MDPPSPMKGGRPNRDEEIPTSPMPKALSGRNCLLGNLVDAKFTCVTAISEKEAVVCTSRGDICMIDDSEGQQRLTTAKNIGFRAQCISTDPENGSIWLGGKHGKLQKESIQQLRDSARGNQTPPSSKSKFLSAGTSPGSPTIAASQTGSTRKKDLLALASILGRLVLLDTDHTLSTISIATELEKTPPVEAQASLQGHHTSVQGVEAIKGKERKAEFVTWSSDGDVRCWDSAGILHSSFTVKLDQHESEDEFDVLNELRIVRSLESGHRFISGDKYGVIR